MQRYRLAHKVNTARRYVPAVATDISKTFRAERKRLAAIAVATALVGCGGGDPAPAEELRIPTEKRQ